LRVLLLSGRRAPARALKPGLEEAGFAVDLGFLADGESKAQAAPYAAVVLDGEKNGDCPLTLLGRWRGAGLPVPVLALAAGKGTAERVRWLDAGADDCLARPFRLPELVARLRALTRRGLGDASPVLRTHDLEVDTAARSVRRAGREIRLTPREYALLELLARHRGRVVTRSVARASLYDEQERNTSNVVDVYVRGLRSKIDRGFDPPLILTRWGHGYVLRADNRPPAS
jgi:DNA-binding response OmpR family regulator